MQDGLEVAALAAFDGEKARKYIMSGNVHLVYHGTINPRRRKVLQKHRLHG